MSRFDSFLDEAGTVLFWTGAAFGAICLLDWLVRTRRISPFSPVARFMRRFVDPLMAPIERRVVRSGGLPSSAPWWALMAVAVGAILFLALARWLGALAWQVAETATNPSLLPRRLASWAIGFLQIAVLVRVLSSWLPISPYSRWIRWSYRTTDWMLAPLRRLIPPLGGSIDITPIVAYFGLVILRGIVG